MNDAHATETELWHVQLPSGGVCCWSLDALDAAFQTGEIGPKTYVRRLGDIEWQRLEVLLGLDESETSPPPAPRPVVAPTPSVAFPASDPRSAVSLRPVVSTVADLDDEYLAAAMKPKRKNLAYVAGGAALALVLGVVGITHASSGSDEKAAAGAQPPAPVAVAPVSDPAAAAPSAPRAELSDDVKRALLEKDKTRAARVAAQAAENAKYRSTSPSYAPVPKSGPVFHKGGNQYDPLNSSL
jgi:hypothetical protein